MQSMQRQFGKLWNRGPGENAKVAVLLNDYEDADNVLAKIIDNAKMWRDSWDSLASSQLQIFTEYEGLYDPIVGASDGQSRNAVPTPPLQLERTFKLKTAYAELKTDFVEELGMIEERVMKPATDARESIAPIRKTIKKRENKRVDYEQAQEKALKLQRKSPRTPKEDAALAKADAEVARAGEEFGIADGHLRTTLPPIITATFDLVGPLLSNLVLIQNRLLGLYYTTLHTFCTEFGFPSPPPPMADVIATWDAAFGPVRTQVESISFIARGKAVHQPMSAGTGLPPSPTTRGPPTTTAGIRRSTTGLISGPKARALRTPSMPLPQEEDQAASGTSHTRARGVDPSNATDFTTAAILGGAAVSRPASSALAAKRGTIGALSAVNTASMPQLRDAALAGVAKKKPPPPPPPPKKKPDEWVVALYAFTGEGGGDLSFREGDRIRVVKRTGTDQDWWVGELGGAQGNFPANYCKPL
ncbi:hypothetical protein C8A05DRAFT_37076 [Staphylotrichum tortipilum]|uniref:SH3 domain-containing protein n=1 Tax=Staphylotrichum tortipilum TaxID=2831512 RepID=A0AAN6RQQ5_9PEZI|nr:hypothetical protein C8A05DRAFT_37076 [Staphylotrichum longicolle]